MTKGTPNDSADLKWSAEETDKMVALWNEGQSSGEIAAVLNCSRSRVCAKASRLRAHGVISRDKVSPATTEARRRAQLARAALAPVRHRKTQEAIPEAPMRLVAASTPKPPRVLIPVPETIEVLNLGLMDMLRSHCRWPTEKDGGEQRYCGNPADGRRSYCSHHAAKMYVSQRDYKVENRLMPKAL